MPVHRLAVRPVRGHDLGRDLVVGRQYDNLAQALMRSRVEQQIWPAFEAFRKSNGRAPESLAELARPVGAAAEALLIAGDDLAEPIEGIEGARSSFRYDPEPQRMNSFGEQVQARFVAIRARDQERMVVTDDGQVSTIYAGDVVRVLEDAEIGSLPRSFPGSRPALRPAHDLFGAAPFAGTAEFAVDRPRTSPDLTDRRRHARRRQRLRRPVRAHGDRLRLFPKPHPSPRQVARRPPTRVRTDGMPL